MNTQLILMAALAVIGVLVGVLGHMAWRRGSQLVSPLSVDGLAERADVNGHVLVQMAKAMREAAAREQREVAKAQLLRWARAAEQVALEHLECINAMTLDKLQSAPDVPVHLGDFNPHPGDRRRNPPLRKPPLLWRSRHG